jgi:hypothetical protein
MSDWKVGDEFKVGLSLLLIKFSLHFNRPEQFYFSTKTLGSLEILGKPFNGNFSWNINVEVLISANLCLKLIGKILSEKFEIKVNRKFLS